MFLFEQALLERKTKSKKLITLKRLKLKKSWKNNSLVICVNLSRLETAMVKADRKCTENYLAATTESDKEAVKAIFENTVTDFVKKSKEAIMKLSTQ